MPNPAKLPTFDELPVKAGAPEGSAWGLWGDDDELGTWNLVTPEKTARAATAGEEGQRLRAQPRRSTRCPRGRCSGSAATPATRSSTAAAASRSRTTSISIRSARSPRRSGTATGTSPTPAFGFYNGRKQDDVIQPGNATLGIQNLAKKGIATRGVLLDVGRYLEKQGQTARPAHSLDDRRRHARRLRAPLRASTFEPGDMLLFRTGWLGWLRAQTDGRTQRTRRGAARPGSARGKEMAA